MELLYKSPNGQFQIKLTGESQKELFEQVSEFQEVFVSHNQCSCGSNEVYFRTRENDGNKFYEKLCGVCHKTFNYGQNKKGNTLFPKGPWVKWTPPEHKEGDEKVFNEEKEILKRADKLIKENGKKAKQ